jgi:hypothetical protein
LLVSRIAWYLEKSAGAAGDLGAAANRFSEHIRGTGKANVPSTYGGHSSAKSIGDGMGYIHADNSVTYGSPHVMATNPRFLEAQKTFNPKNKEQALGAGLSDAADRVIGAPRKMLKNVNFGRNPFSGV